MQEVPEATKAQVSPTIKEKNPDGEDSIVFESLVGFGCIVMDCTSRTGRNGGELHCTVDSEINCAGTG
jgi:hypothetical protein